MSEPPRFFLTENPNLKPRDEVRIERLEAEPSPDGRRVKVQIAVTPFREQPNFEIALVDAAQRHVAGTTVIAAMNFRLEFTLHLRGIPAPGEYTLRADLYYDEAPAPAHRAETTLRLPPDPAP
ncbi:MAG: hypothetical protein AAGU78_11955 [Chloroflexota bacterium]|jgi:hypothetical protein|nr:hypothetical protein [Anaerolineae bacterium]